jgi:hypothetical protein
MLAGNDFKEAGDLKQELQKTFWQQHKMGEHQTMTGNRNSKSTLLQEKMCI